MPLQPARSVQEALDHRWLPLLADLDPRYAASWFYVCRRQLLLAASRTPLRKLFPYTSHNSLHFSRCSAYPFTGDSTWIWFRPDRFTTYEPAASGSRVSMAGPLPPVLCDTVDLDEAVAAAANALPTKTPITWVGSVETSASRP